MYPPAGTEGGKTYYSQSGSLFNQSVVWEGLQWSIYNSLSALMYYSLEDAEFPWQVSTWEIGDGAGPPPTVAEVL